MSDNDKLENLLVQRETELSEARAQIQVLEAEVKQLRVEQEVSRRQFETTKTEVIRLMATIQSLDKVVDDSKQAAPTI